MYLNSHMINPIKRELIGNMIKVAKENPDIIRIIVFGSSVRDDCYEDSDIDICVTSSCGTRNIALSDTIGKMCQAGGGNCDIFHEALIGENLKMEVMKSGIEVYMKENC